MAPRRVATKVRALVVVNNALYPSGAEFLSELERLCTGGWLNIDALIGVPHDVTGTAATRVGVPPVDPAPFALSTKIALLGCATVSRACTRAARCT